VPLLERWPADLRERVLSVRPGITDPASLTFRDEATLLARAPSLDAKARRGVDLEADDLDVRLVVEPIRLSKPPKATALLGIELADVDDEMRAAYDLPASVHVMIADAGPTGFGLGIGRLERGYGLWMVGEKAVGSVRDAVEELVKALGTREEMPSARVVYTYWDEDGSGTNTQGLRGDPERIAELKAVLERLKK